MREFVKGWKRKVGCVTLVMACVFLAGWVNGLMSEDDEDFTWLAGDGIEYSLRLTPEQIEVFKSRLFHDPIRDYITYIALGSISIRHWSIVLPLTAISLLLLLSTPRQSNEKKTAQPIPVEGK